MTSSFGEFRQGHFHGGIDLSTQQAVGKEVHAISDGWVWRVRASGAGYGRAVYFRMADGRTAVFAHLNGYAPSVQAFVEAAQESLSRYEVDLYPGRGRLPFRKGELLAFTGESGAGPPHLHFEIRTGDDANVGVNPLGQGFAVRDTIVPILTGLTLRPWGAGSLVDGSAAPRSYAAVAGGGSPRVGSSSLRLRETPRITGAALATVRAFDPSGTGNRLSPYAVSIAVDGRLLHEFRLDHFQWDKAHEVEIAYDFEKARAGDDYVLKLYRPIGASNVVFDPMVTATAPPSSTAEDRSGIAESPLSGIIAAGDPQAMTRQQTLAPGEHTAEVIASDAAGNTARLAFTFRLDAAPETPVIIVRKNAPAGGDANPAASPAKTAGAAGSRAWLTWTARTNALDVVVSGAGVAGGARAPGPGATRTPADRGSDVERVPAGAEQSTVTIETPLGSRTVALGAVSGTGARASIPIPEGLYAPVRLRADLAAAAAGASAARTPLSETLDLAVVTRGPAAVLRLNTLTLDAPEHAFFGPGVIRYSSRAAAATPGLAPVGPAVELDTDVVPDRALTVRLKAPAGTATERLGLYRLTDSGQWTWLGNGPHADGISGETRYLTTFALLVDTAPPTIGALRPRQGQVVANGRPEIFAGIDDRGSGFSWKEIETTIDGVPQIVVYDPESGTLRGRSRRDLAPGPHTLILTVHDQAGNVTVQSATFRVRG